MKQIIVIGVVLMAFGVALGAFGAHGLKDKIAPNLMAAYQTGVEYHFYHALGLILLGLVSFHYPAAGGIQSASWVLLVGVLLFSGSLYLMAFTGVRWLGAITPIGGAAFIVGWVWVAVALIRNH